MDKQIKECLDQAIWCARSLFERNKVSGSSANLSLKIGDTVYITASGSCFGNLDYGSFVPVGYSISSKKPSKELPLHQILYDKDLRIKAVLHTHSMYSVLWSMIYEGSPEDCIPSYTPYLRMKLGSVGLVPYAEPGSTELFSNFRACVNLSDGFILKNHGPVVGGKDIMDAFYILEELEESAHIAWEMDCRQKNTI